GPRDQVWLVLELYPFLAQRLRGGVDVAGAEVEDGDAGLFLGERAEHQPDVAAVEKGQLAELSHERQPQRLMVEADHRRQIARRDGYLSDPPDAGHTLHRESSGFVTGRSARPSLES